MYIWLVVCICTSIKPGSVMGDRVGVVKCTGLDMDLGMVALYMIIVTPFRNLYSPMPLPIYRIGHGHGSACGFGCGYSLGYGYEFRNSQPPGAEYGYRYSR